MYWKHPYGSLNRWWELYIRDLHCEMKWCTFANTAGVPDKLVALPTVPWLLEWLAPKVVTLRLQLLRLQEEMKEQSGFWQVFFFVYSRVLWWRAICFLPTVLSFVNRSMSLWKQAASFIHSLRHTVYAIPRRIQYVDVSLASAGVCLSQTWDCFITFTKWKSSCATNPVLMLLKTDPTIPRTESNLIIPFHRNCSQMTKTSILKNQENCISYLVHSSHTEVFANVSSQHFTWRWFLWFCVLLFQRLFVGVLFSCPKLNFRLNTFSELKIPNVAHIAHFLKRLFILCSSRNVLVSLTRTLQSVFFIVFVSRNVFWGCSWSFCFNNTLSIQSNTLKRTVHRIMQTGLVLFWATPEREKCWSSSVSGSNRVPQFWENNFSWIFSLCVSISTELFLRVFAKQTEVFFQCTVCLSNWTTGPSLAIVSMLSGSGLEDHWVWQDALCLQRRTKRHRKKTRLVFLFYFRLSCCSKRQNAQKNPLYQQQGSFEAHVKKSYFRSTKLLWVWEQLSRPLCSVPRTQQKYLGSVNNFRLISCMESDNKACSMIVR